MRALVVLGLVVFRAKPTDWLGEHLRNDPFCVEWDVKPQLNQSINQLIVTRSLFVRTNASAFASQNTATTRNSAVFAWFTVLQIAQISYALQCFFSGTETSKVPLLARNLDPLRHLMHGFLPHKHRRERSKNIARARVRASAVQPGTHPKAVLGWAWKGSGLGSQSDSVWTLYWRMKNVGYEKAKVSDMRKWNLTDQ